MKLICVQAVQAAIDRTFWPKEAESVEDRVAGHAAPVVRSGGH